LRASGESVSAGDGVSVIVPFLNGARHIRDLLESLVCQDYSAPWQVVAVDNGSSDGTRDIVREYQARLPLALVDAFEQANPSFARNIGVRRSNGSRLLFIDADDAVGPHYVSAMSAALQQSPMVTSRVDSVRLNAEWVRSVHGPPWQEAGVGRFFDFLPATGVNIGIRRTLFEELGGFSDEFSGSEDVDFSWTAQLVAGVQIQFVPDAVYYYRYRDSYYGLFRQSANWGRDTACLYRKYRSRGMPGRQFSVTTHDWRRAFRALMPSLTPAERASAVVALGYCVGRLRGSIQYGLRYL
jgi:glycosyltransferase involved in cell wall biosynthesis